MLNSNFWAKYFKVYDILNKVIPYQELLAEVVKEADIKNGDLVLDVGGGTGNLTLLLEKEGAEVVNLDFSQEALEIHKKKNPHGQIILHDLTQKLPLPDNNFDKIISNNTLYNLPREKRLETMLELKRVLKPNGKIEQCKAQAQYQADQLKKPFNLMSIKAQETLATLEQNLNNYRLKYAFVCINDPNGSECFVYNSEVARLERNIDEGRKTVDAYLQTANNMAQQDYSKFYLECLNK